MFCKLLSEDDATISRVAGTRQHGFRQTSLNLIQEVVNREMPCKLRNFWETEKNKRIQRLLLDLLNKMLGQRKTNLSNGGFW